MIAKIVKGGRRKTFRGTALYILRGEKHERVLWTDMQNIGSSNPHLAYRTMATLSSSQHRATLRERAGISRAGRHSDDVAQHMVLSWTPEESAGLTRSEMLEAAKGALKAIGAAKYQALFVAHGDTDCAHVHILLNRVNQENGKLLSTSNDHLKLSKWAQAYEEQRGKVVCAQRVANNARRGRGEYVRARKGPPIHIRDAEDSAAANDNSGLSSVMIAQQKALTLALSARAKREAKDQRQREKQLEKDYRAAKRQLRAEGLARRDAVLASIEEDYTQRKLVLLRDQMVARHRFAVREGTLGGRAVNTLQSIEWRRLGEQPERQKALALAFETQARFAALARQEEAARLALEQEERRRLREEKRIQAARRREEKAGLEARYRTLRDALEERHAQEKAALQGAWRQRQRDREAAFARLTARPAPILDSGKEKTRLAVGAPHLTAAFNAAATGQRIDAEEGRSPAPVHAHRLGRADPPPHQSARLPMRDAFTREAIGRARSERQAASVKTPAKPKGQDGPER